LQADLNLTTSFLIGATLQALLVLLLPKRYALTPAIILLGIHFIDAILVAKGVKPNPYLKNVVWKKSTPQVLDGNGELKTPGQEKVAILLLGAKSNHPMGIFSPDYKVVNDFLRRMTDELEDPKNYNAGCKHSFYGFAMTEN
jgi:hypothetical protein